MLYFMLGAGVLALSIVFRLAAVFRLTIPLLYALIVPTLFHGWFYSHQALAEGIWYGLLALTLLSWVVSLVRKITGIIDQRRCDRADMRLFADWVREARRNGETAVRTDDLWN